MGSKTRHSRTPAPRITALQLSQLKTILERTRTGPLTDEDFEALTAAVDTLSFLTRELQLKGASLKRLRRLLFGTTSEKTDDVFKGKSTDSKDTSTATGSTDTSPEPDSQPEKKETKPGHGRTSAEAYEGAKQVHVEHALHAGTSCPGCEKGKVYPLAEPARLVRVEGVAPLSATVYSCDRLRCNLCGEVFTAEAPEGVGDAKYDETASSMVGLLKYGVGLPFHRIEKLQANLKIPLPAATQWDLVDDAADVLAPAHQELIRQAAQGEVLHNDDTTMKILGLTREQRAEAGLDEERTGTFTSGIVSTRAGKQIALFMTGGQHAGENLADVLAQRAQELPKPVQMCDALSANADGVESILASCNAHARRKFVEVAEDFPEEVRHLLEEFRTVYRIDAEARQRHLSAMERLRLHQEQSGPVMGKLKKWAKHLLSEKKVEPNSGLGEALTYLLKHWRKLTQFLKVPGAPLDNNICERALKKAILHRKNSLFYRTQRGAQVGDLFMSLIHTCELNGVDAFDYLVALQRHAEQVREQPSEWMPWTYQATRSKPTAQPTLH